MLFKKTPSTPATNRLLEIEAAPDSPLGLVNMESARLPRRIIINGDEESHKGEGASFTTDPVLYIEENWHIASSDYEVRLILYVCRFSNAISVQRLSQPTQKDSHGVSFTVNRLQTIG